MLDGGTVNLSPYRVEPPTNGVAYWLDAMATNTLAKDRTGNVTNWVSRSGNNAAFKQPSNTRYLAPTYAAAGLNGRGAVRFEGTNWLSTLSSCTVQTLFLVNAVLESS